MNPCERIGWKDIAQEPFRIFFPAAVLTGIFGVALWPLHFAGIVAFYPGISHAQLMAHGFFGGFIFGVLGTGLPRMLSVKRFALPEVLLLFAIYVTAIVFNLRGRVTNAAIACLLLLVAFAMCVIPRFSARRDLPPPGFVMVALALACLAGGTTLSIVETYSEDFPLFWHTMQRLLSYQGFVLLPILGVGSFLLPRFFALPNRHEFSESRTPLPGWAVKAGWAAATGVGVLISFVLEALGWERIAHALRASISGIYLFTQVPIHRSALRRDALRACLAVAIVMTLGGLFVIALYPINKVAVLHLTLVGGFAVLTYTVATRVVLGHSGNQPLLLKPNRWLVGAVALMLLGMATRVSADIIPAVRVSHYTYGAIAWIMGSALWAIQVLPKVLIRDPDPA
jgi:uncharacterized protein involved in response to NO